MASNLAHRQVRAHIERFDPFLPQAGADSLVRSFREYGRYGMYSEEGLNQGIGEELPQRFDAAFHYLKSGGLGARREDLATLVARTNYFRETYAYGEDIRLPGIEPFLRSEALADAARQVFDLPIIEPSIVFANIMLPGQELAIHTDVPEFRGANRKNLPEWLLVVMHHSELFADERIPIATAVSWFHSAEGGAFLFYPDGPDGAAERVETRSNSAVLLDTDSIFHGVEAVGSDAPVPRLSAGMELVPVGDEDWVVVDQDREIARFGTAEIRFSVSWKAYCFPDEATRDRCGARSTPRPVEEILCRLERDLIERGVIDQRPKDVQVFARTLVDEYLQFPAQH